MTKDSYALDGSAPQTVLSPQTAQELARALAQCNADKRAVIPWGGGTLQHLGNLPTRYDCVLQTGALNQVIDYAFDDLTITVGAGMTLSEITAILGEHGQFLPIDVPHPERATIGGVLATSVNGPLRLRYGPARDFMLGNRFATVDGNLIKAGSKVVKNVAGYELHKVQVGAFGTLGVLTEATFKIFPKPTAEVSVWSSFETLADACAAVPVIWSLSTPPLAIELLDAGTAQMVLADVAGNWHVIARFGGSPATVAAARDMSIQAANEQHAGAAQMIENGAAVWAAIADLPADLIENVPDGVVVRASIPPKQLRAAVDVILQQAAAFKLAAPALTAHAAVCSIYAGFSGDTAALRTLVTALRAALHPLEGHLIVESAPSALKPNLPTWEEAGPTFKMMQALKDKFDPNHILNPGRFYGGI